MASSDILVFASTTNQVTTQANYVTLSLAGNPSGTIADNSLVNKALRQSSTISAALAQFISNNLNINITDADPNPLTKTNFLNYITQTFPTLSGNNSFSGSMYLPPNIGGVTGSALNNAIVWSTSGAWQAGQVGGGSVYSVNTGLGLTGGPIVTTGVISLLPATSTSIGGVKPDGTSTIVNTNGVLSVLFPASFITLDQNTPTYIATGYRTTNAGGFGGNLAQIVGDVRASFAVGQEIVFQIADLSKTIFSITSLSYNSGLTSIFFFPTLGAADSFNLGAMVYKTTGGPQRRNPISEIEFLNSNVTLTGFKATIEPEGGGGGGGGGTVTSVGLLGPAPFTFGNPITTNGNLTFAWGPGFIPAANLAIGTADSTTYLRGDNRWITINSAMGTVTNVTASAPMGFAFNITNPSSTPAIALTYSTDLIPQTSLGVNTPTSSTFLRGDQKWVPIPSSAGGTVTQIVAGIGLLGGTITNTGTIDLRAASSGVIGGVMADTYTTNVNALGVLTANLNFVGNLPTFTNSGRTTTTSGSFAGLTGIFMSAGDNTAIFPAGTRIIFQNSRVIGQIYTVTTSAFASAITTTTFTPTIAFLDDFFVGTNIYLVTGGPASRTSFYAIGNQGSVDNGVLTISMPTPGGASVPYVQFTGSATASAGQTFTSAILAGYTSDGSQATVVVNGAVLTPNTGYTIVGSTLTILDFIDVSAVIQVQARSATAGGAGSITNVSLSTPASFAFSVTNSTTAPVIGFANVTSAATQFLRGDGAWVAPAIPVAVTNVSFGSPASLAFAVATPSTTPVISFNAVTAPSTQFLRGDGAWVAPSGISIAGGWAIAQSGTKLAFSYNGVLVASLGSNGLFTSANNVTAFGTP